MSGIEMFAKNAALLSGKMLPVYNNSPDQYANRQVQYYDRETRRFVQNKAKYASDFVAASVQGLTTGDKNEWGDYRIRFADVVRPTAAIQRYFDDYKQYLFESERIEYVSPGTKIITMGNTWLVLNPNNISGASGTGICRRCNAVWNHLDYYGNVVSEPIIAENERANANDSDSQQSQYITKGYFNITCQYNENTAQIDTNTRMILGSAAYRVTGFSDFEQEFTGDYSTVRLLRFTVRYEEPNDVIDDMVNHVAGGKIFSWSVSVDGPSNLPVGASGQCTAYSYRNGALTNGTPTDPITYIWESSDESVVTVDDGGMVEAIGEGSATIRVKVAQNTDHHINFQITVTDTQDGVFFTENVPQSMSAYQTATLSAAYYEDGEETAEQISFSTSGADESAYKAEADGNDLTVTCYGYSATPLTITATYGTYSATATIDLEGI